MLEKSGTTVLTDEEIKQIKAGLIPQRLADDWGKDITLFELQEMVTRAEYTAQ